MHNHSSGFFTTNSTKAGTTKAVTTKEGDNAMVANEEWDDAMAAKKEGKEEEEVEEEEEGKKRKSEKITGDDDVYGREGGEAMMVEEEGKKEEEVQELKEEAVDEFVPPELLVREEEEEEEEDDSEEEEEDEFTESFHLNMNYNDSGVVLKATDLQLDDANVLPVGFEVIVRPGSIELDSGFVSEMLNMGNVGLVHSNKGEHSYSEMSAELWSLCETKGLTPLWYGRRGATSSGFNHKWTQSIL